MIKLNTYIIEAWSGVKKQSIKADIEAWCDEMGIEKYTINSKGEIDVNGGVDLAYKDFKELPYKFGTVNWWFDVGNNKNLISLNNCPNIIIGNFSCSDCPQLDSLEGCPEKVKDNFFCRRCKRKFTKEEVMASCKVKKENIYA